MPDNPFWGSIVPDELRNTNPRTGTLLETTELPQNRDRHESIAPDDLRSSCAKAPFRGLSRLGARRYGGDGSAVDTMGKGKGVEHGPFFVCGY